MPNLEVVMPKFTFRSKFLLGRTLAKLEMPSAFSSGADFSGMEETGEIFIGKVTHEVFIAVNDEGTETAVATAMPFVATSPGKVLVERPFVFLIRHSGTGTILSLGRVVDPGDDHHARKPSTSPQARFI
jgi:serpin B